MIGPRSSCLYVIGSLFKVKKIINLFVFGTEYQTVNLSYLQPELFQVNRVSFHG